MNNPREFSLVTAAYWCFTLTDGALRMLVLLHFHQLGFSPVNIAFLFLLYEFFGIITNLFGGWIGSRVGLKFTLYAGLATQIVALLLLSMLNTDWALGFSVAYVMGAQALSGIAKDLTKMSSKSAVKLLAPDDSQSRLFKWVALLTGSKNALKGLGFFLGAVLLTHFGFQQALWAMAGALGVTLLAALLFIRRDMGKTKGKAKFVHLLSKSHEINVLSAARFFLFGARDVWFVVGLPIFLSDVLGWTFNQVGGFLAIWVIGYGFVQVAAPKIIRGEIGLGTGARAARAWSVILAIIPLFIAYSVQTDTYPAVAVVGGLALFGAVFAMNSSLHSYLILAFSDSDQVALNVGFYYMANAMGRLVGTLLSGLLYLQFGLAGCLWTSAGMLMAAAILTFILPVRKKTAEPATS